MDRVAQESGAPDVEHVPLVLADGGRSAARSALRTTMPARRDRSCLDSTSARMTWIGKNGVCPILVRSRTNSAVEAVTNRTELKSSRASLVDLAKAATLDARDRRSRESVSACYAARTGAGTQ